MIEFIHIAKAAETAANIEQETSLVSTLGLNWKLFLAQLINFGIIFYILNRFVFKPISLKLAERSQKIEQALKDAEDVEKQKTEFELWKAEEVKQARQKASEILTKAEQDALTAKDMVLKKTKEEQDKYISQARAQIESDQKQSLAEIKSEVADMVTMATEKVLKKKLDDKHDIELIKKTVEEISHNKQ